MAEGGQSHGHGGVAGDGRARDSNECIFPEHCHCSMCKQLRTTDKKFMRKFFDEYVTPVVEEERKKSGGGPIDFKTALAPVRELLKKKLEERISIVKKGSWCIICDRPAKYQCCDFICYCSIKCQAKHWEKEHKVKCQNPDVNRKFKERVQEKDSKSKILAKYKNATGNPETKDKNKDKGFRTAERHERTKTDVVANSSKVMFEAENKRKARIDDKQFRTPDQVEKLKMVTNKASVKPETQGKIREHKHVRTRDKEEKMKIFDLIKKTTVNVETKSKGGAEDKKVRTSGTDQEKKLKSLAFSSNALVKDESTGKVRVEDKHVRVNVQEQKIKLKIVDQKNKNVTTAKAETKDKVSVEDKQVRRSTETDQQEKMKIVDKKNINAAANKAETKDKFGDADKPVRATVTDQEQRLKHKDKDEQKEAKKKHKHRDREETAAPVEHRVGNSEKKPKLDSDFEFKVPFPVPPGGRIVGRSTGQGVPPTKEATFPNTD